MNVLVRSLIVVLLAGLTFCIVSTMCAGRIIGEIVGDLPAAHYSN